MMLESADDFETDIANGKATGRMDTLWKRNAEEARAAAEQLAERAAEARADAAATREQIARVDRTLVDLDNEVRVSGDDNQAARMAIFALDDQASSIEEAARRYGEAAAAGDNIPERAAKELAAEEALRSAERRPVDREAIRRVIPSFPEQTPGLDDHPWPPATPVIGPEETLDPFGDGSAADNGDPALPTDDVTALADTFDGAAADDGSSSSANEDGSGGDAEWFDGEAAQLGAEPTAVAELTGYGDTDTALGSEPAGGYDDVSDSVAFTDPAAGYDTGYAEEPSGGYADELGGADDYASATDGGYDDGSVA